MLNIRSKTWRRFLSFSIFLSLVKRELRKKLDLEGIDDALLDATLNAVSTKIPTEVCFGRSNIYDGISSEMYMMGFLQKYLWWDFFRKYLTDRNFDVPQYLKNAHPCVNTCSQLTIKSPQQAQLSNFDQILCLFMVSSW